MTKNLELHKFYPNIVTIMGLIAGLSAIKYGFQGHYDKSVIAILVAAIIDGMDGRLARLLNASSNFGAQLDSLSDFVNFGVAPALIMYFWSMHDIKAVGWAACLFFIICCALRLARFNVDETDNEEPSKFFCGVAAPAGGLLALLPIAITLIFEDLTINYLPIINIIYITIIALLMVSNIKTFSAKAIKINKKYGSLLLAFFGFFMVLLITHTWFTLTVIALIYLLSIPVTCLMSLKNNKN